MLTFFPVDLASDSATIRPKTFQGSQRKEALNGEKEKSQRQSQAQKNARQQGNAQQHRQKSQDNPQQGGQEATSSASTTEESRTGRKDCSQADADQ